MMVAPFAFLFLVTEPVPAPALQTCPDGSTIRAEARCLTFDHRGQIALRPETEAKTVEWRCKTHSARAQVRTIELPFTNDRGEPVAKQAFKVELAELLLDGAPASAQLQARVRSELAPLNSLIQLYGRCFADVPTLNIVGYSPSAAPRQRRAQIEFK